MGNGAITDIVRYAWRVRPGGMGIDIGDDVKKGNWGGVVNDILFPVTGLFVGRGDGKGDEGLIPALFHDLVWHGDKDC